MTLTRTLSEIRATCTKAARGAGCPWGLAEEAGMAARVLESHELPGAETLATLFDTPRSCACDGDADAPACGLAEAAALSDGPPEHDLQLGPVAGPLLLIAPCLLDNRTAWQITWPGGAAECGATGLSLSGDPAPKVAEWVHVKRMGAAADARSPGWHSRPVSQDAWTRLEALAAKTYVPDTDASRSAGAGPDAAETD